MALNPHTLNRLYQNGILEYVPTDLITGSPVVTAMPISNPYIDMAKQGGLYQNHGMETDSFHSSFTPAYTPQYFQSASSSANSYIGANTYNPGSIGYNGQNSNMYDKNAYGGITEIPNNIANGVNKTVSFFDKMPKLLLGIIGGGIGTYAIISAFKHGRKPKTEQSTGLLSKLNPLNWFRKNK